MEKNDALNKEIDWIKFSMDTDKNDYPIYFNTLLQNVTIRLIFFFGILPIINLLIITYLPFLDVLHFILINFSLILLFLINFKLSEFREKNLPGGIDNIRKEFNMKKYLLIKRYKELGVDLDKIQKEFDELKVIY